MIGEPHLIQVVKLKSGGYAKYLGINAKVVPEKVRVQRFVSERGLSDTVDEIDPSEISDDD
jgi:hypothetical protein